MEVKYGAVQLKSLLDKARIFNRQIGEFQCFTVTDDFKYIVKLTNGTIWFELIDLQRNERFELNPEMLESMASRFNAESERKPRVWDNFSRAKLSRNALGWSLITFMLLMGLIGGGIELGKRVGLFVEPKVAEVEQPQAQAKSAQAYEQQVRRVVDIEKEHPARFIFAEGDYRKNIWGTKFKLNVDVLNKATSTGFKNAVLRISFLNENEKIIKLERLVLEEKFPPGSSTAMRLKLDAPDDATSIKWQIIDAKSL